MQRNGEADSAAPQALSAAGRLPNLVIAGVAKAGTTSLFSYLTQHPDICGSDVKELRYFTPLRFGGALGVIDDYMTHFGRCADRAYALEATPGYFYGGEPLARALRETLPDPRVIVSLRAPGDRCWSWYRFVKMRLNIPRDTTFSEYLDRCEELHDAGSDTAEENYAYWGLGGGCYDLYLDAWLDHFGHRLRIVSFEDLGSEPEQVVSDICQWLGLDVSVVGNFQFRVENRTQQYRMESLQRLAMQVNRRSERVLRGHSRVKRSLRAAYYSLNREATGEKLTAADRDRLVNFYRPHNARLARQLSVAGLPLPAWLDNARGGRP